MTILAAFSNVNLVILASFSQWNLVDSSSENLCISRIPRFLWYGDEQDLPMIACMSLWLSIKKSLFPVQRVAKIVASWASAFFFFLGGGGGLGGVTKILSILGGKNIFAKMKKKSLQLHLFQSPGRYAGNIFIFMDSLCIQIQEGVGRLVFTMWHIYLPPSSHSQIRDRSLVMGSGVGGGGVLQNEKIEGLKLVAPPNCPKNKAKVVVLYIVPPPPPPHPTPPARI